MPTDEEIFADFEAGKISQDDFDNFLNGDELKDEKTTDSTEDSEKVDDGAGDSSTPEKIEATKDEEKSVEQVIMAKDGVHVIPYSELTDSRDKATKLAAELAVLQAKLQDQTALFEQLSQSKELEEAKQIDAVTGTTEAVDELISDLALEFPEAAKLMKNMQAQLEKLSTKEAEKEAAAAEEQARTKAEKAFDEAVTALEPTYHETTTNPKFWEWFNAQPAYIQKAKNSGDPEVVASIIKTYLTIPPAKVGETTQKKPDMGKVQEAIKNAEDKTSSFNSLSDLSGGAAVHSEDEKLANMSDEEFDRYLKGKSPEEIEKIMAKMV